MKRSILEYALIAGLALLAGFLVSGWLTPDPPVRYERVIVPESVLVVGRPDTIVRWRERLVTRVVQAEQVATAPAAALPDVGAYCAAAGWVVRSAGVDSIPPGEPTGPPAPERLLLSAFAYDRGDLTLWGPLSGGDLWRGDYRVGRRFTGTVNGADVLIQADRFDGARRWGERLLWVGAGAAVGYAAGELGR